MSNTALPQKRSGGTAVVDLAHRLAEALIRFTVRHKKGAVGLVLLTGIILASIFAPIISPHPPTEMNTPDRFSSPNSEYLLGTDFYGRDLLSRVLYGYRQSLTIAISAVFLSMTIGGLLGILAGFFRRVDTLIMRIMDVIFAFPVLLLAITIVVILGTGATSTILAIGIVYIPIFARIARGPTLSVKEEAYVEAATAIGATSSSIIARHMLPNVAAPIMVQATIQLAVTIIFESALSFLGLGTQPPDASLGLMVSNGRDYLDLSPWPTLIPSFAIVLIVLSFNLVGDSLQDMLDPQMKRRI